MKVYKSIFDETMEPNQWWNNFQKLYRVFDKYGSTESLRRRNNLLYEFNLNLVIHDDVCCVSGEEKDVLFFIMKYS